MLNPPNDTCNIPQFFKPVWSIWSPESKKLGSPEWETRVAVSDDSYEGKNTVCPRSLDPFM